MPAGSFLLANCLSGDAFSAVGERRWNAMPLNVVKHPVRFFLLCEMNFRKISHC